jgi:hypothetical protein
MKFFMAWTKKKKPKLKINKIKGKLKSSFHYEMDYLFIWKKNVTQIVKNFFFHFFF